MVRELFTAALMVQDGVESDADNVDTNEDLDMSDRLCRID